MGITYRVSQILANHHINITDLNAQCIEGESQPVYVMMIEILLPEAAATGPSDALRADLSELAQSEVLDIRFLPVNSATF
jgi:predicted amino acid-binding ACT domain protein